MADAARELIWLAMERFGNLLPGEAKMLRAAAEGTVADVADQEGDVVLTGRQVGSQPIVDLFPVDEDEADDSRAGPAQGVENHAPSTAPSPAPQQIVAPPAPAVWNHVAPAKRKWASAWGCWEDWGEHRTIRAEVLAWAVADARASELTHSRGLAISQARILGRVVLDGMKLRHPISWHGCAIEDGLSLQGATMPGLDLCGCHVFGIAGKSTKCEGLCDLAGLVCRGSISLENARVGGDLRCSNISIESSWESSGHIQGLGRAIKAAGIEVGGTLDLRQCTIDGVVDLSQAKVDGTLECRSSRIENSADDYGGDVLCCTGARVARYIVLEWASVKGGVCLDDAVIGDGLFLRRASIRNPAFSDGNGGLDCRPSLSAVRADVGGGVWMQDGLIVGEVRLTGAHVRRGLLCTGTKIEGCDVPEKPARSIVGDRMQVGGGVNLGKKTDLRGEVRFVEAVISGHLACDGCQLHADAGGGKAALRLDRARVAGAVRLRTVGTGGWGDVSMVRTSVDGDLELQKLDCCGSVRLRRATIGNTMRLGDATHVADTLDLDGARARRVHDTPSAWEGVGTINLRGFSYESFAGEQAMTADERIAWVRRGMTDADGIWRYDASSYHQLAGVYTATGRRREAVLVRKEQYRAKRGYERPDNYGLRSLNGWAMCGWRWLVIKLLGCGYDRARPLLWLVALWLAGVFMFWLGEGLMVPASDQVLTSQAYVESRAIPPDYQPFSEWVYSADAMLPIVELHQERYWLPNAHPTRGWGWWLRWYLWIHIAAGWFLSTFLVVGMTGLVRNEQSNTNSE